MNDQTPLARITFSAIRDKVVDVITGRRFRTSATEMTRFFVGWMAVVLAIATLVFLFLTGAQSTYAGDKPVALLFLVVWTVLPPIFFWFDYYVLWTIEHKTNAPGHLPLDEFKHGQEISRNLWLALVALLAAIYFK